MAGKEFRLGRDFNTGPLRYVCTLRFSPESGVSFDDETDNIDVALSQAEKRAILRLFGEPIRTRVSQTDDHGRIIMGTEVLEPGTEKHFQTVAHRLPKPFYKMPGGPL